MLEDLLTAIDGCFLLWRESSDIVDDEIGGGDGGGDGEGDSEATESMDGDEVLGRDDVEDDDDGEAWCAEAADRFCEDLRRAMHGVGSPA